MIYNDCFCFIYLQARALSEESRKTVTDFISVLQEGVQEENFKSLIQAQTDGGTSLLTALLLLK